MHKSRSSYRDGYKAHIAIEPETGIITACDLTPANIGDGPVGVELLKDEDDRLVVVFGDSAYGSGAVRADLRDAQHAAVIKPWPLAPNRRLGDDQFTRDDFTIDYQGATVTCPNNVTVTITPGGAATFGAKCRGCPIPDRCTAAKGGKPYKVAEHNQLLAQARAQWRTETDLADYKQYRPMVERSIAWLVTNGHRRVKYRGVERNRIALSVRVAAINLRRMINLDHGPNGWELAT